MKKTFRVYGDFGHRQKESFNASHSHDFSTDGKIRIIEIRNADITGTNDYSEVVITRQTERECLEEIRGQITDGFFENSKTGKVTNEHGDIIQLWR